MDRNRNADQEMHGDSKHGDSHSSHDSHESSHNHAEHRRDDQHGHDHHSHGYGASHNNIPTRRRDVRDYMCRMNHMVRHLAKQKLVGRKMITVYGPVGGGLQSIGVDVFSEDDGAKIDLLGTGKPHEIERESRYFIQLPILYKDFVLSWRDIELEKHNNIMMDLSLVEQAASEVFLAEDNMIFNGAPEYNQPGLLNVNGRNEFKINGWEKAGDALKSVSEALAVIYKRVKSDRLPWLCIRICLQDCIDCMERAVCWKLITLKNL